MNNNFGVIVQVITPKYFKKVWSRKGCPRVVHVLNSGILSTAFK
jgi:hypothetical protein